MLEKYNKKDSVYKYRGITCLNCHLPLEKNDNFCPNCGQINSTKKLSFTDFFSELFSGLFAYDSRFQRTFRILLFRPGKISKDYINGKRMRYANPFRFYLSVSIIFFLLFSFTLNSNENFSRRDKDENLIPPVAFENADDQKTLDSLRNVTGNAIYSLDSLDSLNTSENSGTYLDKMVTKRELDSMSFLSSLQKKVELYYAFHEESGINNSTRALDSLKQEQTGLNNWIYRKTVDADTFRNDPGLFLNYFISKLPFIIFFYLPVFAFFIWLIYLRRNFNYMEHLIFAFHVQTMFFVLYSIALILEIITQTDFIMDAANFVFLFYLYNGMRYFYGQSHVKTILKFVLLNIIFFTLALIAAILSLLASFSIY